MTPASLPPPRSLETGGYRIEVSDADGSPRNANLGAGILAIALALAVLTVAATREASDVAIFLLIGLTVATVAAVVGSLRTVLLGLIVLDIPLQWDVQLPLGVQAPDVGGVVAGLPISVTTASLALLYAMWTASSLAYEKGPSRAPILPIVLPLLVFAGISTLSLAVANDALLGSFGLAVLLEALLLFIYIVGTVRSRADIQLIMSLLLVGLVIEGLVIALTSFAGLDTSALGLSTSIGGTDELSRAGGTIGNPNVAASYLAFLLAPALATAWWARTSGMRLLGLAAFAVGAVGLLATLSRGGWLAFVVSMIVLVVIGMKQRWISAGRFALAAVALTIVMAPIAPALVDRVTGYTEPAQARIPLLGVAQDMIVDHPILGVGTNNYTVAMADYLGPELTGEFTAAVHNKFLLVLAEAGPLALAAFVWFLAAALHRSWRLTRAGHVGLSPLTLGLGAGLAGQVAHMMVETFHLRSQITLIALVAGLLGAIGIIIGERRSPTRGLADSA